jgi:hypothetical protein
LGGLLESSGPRFGFASARIGRSFSIDGTGPSQSIGVPWERLEGFAADGQFFGSLLPAHSLGKIVCLSRGMVEAVLSISGIVPQNRTVIFGIEHMRNASTIEVRDVFFVVGSNQDIETGIGSWAFDVEPGDQLNAVVRAITPTTFSPHYLQLSAFKTTN